MEDILTAGHRARDLVTHLNQAVRAGQEEPLGPVGLNEQVRVVVDMARPRWRDEPESRGVTVDVVAELGETPAIRGSAPELGAAILNLVLNAVDSMPDGGIITIATQVVDAGVQLTVEDTGVGMDEETRRRAFEPFFTTKMDVGSGLGLSTIHGTVTRWGGTIEVASTPGQGTIFTLCFPVWTGAADLPETPAAPATPVRHGALLIVEDDGAVCELLDRLLSRIHTVTIVQDGREAVEQFVSGEYDVALIDLGLPSMAGDQVAAQMKAADPRLATILITGWPLAGSDPRRSRFDFLLKKPFDDLSEVESVVAQAVVLRDSREG